MDDDISHLLNFRLIHGKEEPVVLPAGPHEELMHPGEVAELFGVDPQTVHEWTRRKGSRLAKLVVWTAGGHARYPRAKVIALREELYATD